MLFQGAHGFMKAHKWRDSVGAVINVEASGTGGLGMIAFGANFISFNFNGVYVVMILFCDWNKVSFQWIIGGWVLHNTYKMLCPVQIRFCIVVMS